MKIMKSLRIAALAGALVFVTGAFLYGQAAARSFYVSITGDDTANNGRSEEAPFRTLQKAFDTAKAGTVRTITVIGPFSAPDSRHLRLNEGGQTEFLITGKPDSGALLIDHALQIDSKTKLRLENIELKGDTNPNYKVEYAAYNRGGTLTLGKGVRIFGYKKAGVNNSSRDEQMGTLIMEGDAVIDDCETGVEDSGVFTMKDDAVITGCGCGVRMIGYKGQFTMQGNAKITGNKYSGVDVSGDLDNLWNQLDKGRFFKGLFIMEGNAEISGNTGDDGAGIHIRGGVVILRGNAKVTGNTARGNGGGIYVEDGGGGTYSSNTVFNVQYALTVQDNALVSGNRAKNGGGVYANKALVLITGKASLTENTASQGGGIYTRNPEVLECARNTPGVYYANYLRVDQLVLNVTMTGGTVSGNKADYGAGVYAEAGKKERKAFITRPDNLGRKYISYSDTETVSCYPFVLNGGSITGNAAEFVGGGIYAVGDLAYSRVKGALSGNTAGDGEGEDLFVKK
jgi:parallel beta-helix repeat protein/predicted outer membrane repeat protein